MSNLSLPKHTKKRKLATWLLLVIVGLPAVWGFVRWAGFYDELIASIMQPMSQRSVDVGNRLAMPVSEPTFTGYTLATAQATAEPAPLVGAALELKQTVGIIDSDKLEVLQVNYCRLRASIPTQGWGENLDESDVDPGAASNALRLEAEYLYREIALQAFTSGSDYPSFDVVVEERCK